MKILSVVGARPQFIKCALVSKELRKEANEILVHTGQHYDENMSAVFFKELEIPKPEYNLEVGSGTHAQQTGEMLKKLEGVFLKERPDYVIVYGDTNSTLAGALAAVKLHLPVAHIEAGMRNFNRDTPEEINRLVTDRISTLFFCPTETAVKNLQHEGIREGIHWVGDVMYDAAIYYGERAEESSRVLTQYNLERRGYALATLHRAESTDEIDCLQSILGGLEKIAQSGLRVILPLHPRSVKQMRRFGLKFRFVEVLEPVSYLEMLSLEKNAELILTDSGGVQKEAYFFRVPCLTLSLETPWIETVEAGWNTLVGTDHGSIIAAVENRKEGIDAVWPYGQGDAARKITEILFQQFSTVQ